MDRSSDHNPQLLLLVAGAYGAIGTTLAVAVAAMNSTPEVVMSALTTADKFPFLGACPSVAMAGWDPSGGGIGEAIVRHGVIPDGLWRPQASHLAQMSVFDAPNPTQPVAVDAISGAFMLVRREALDRVMDES
jgi:myo-inositol-1-phosphate synthase